MSIHFSRSLRRLEADGTRHNIISLTLVTAVLALWFAWFVAARVAVYATTGSARLEVDQESHPVDAPVGGRVIVVPLEAGRIVKAGDVLLELDASPERLAKDEAQAKLDPSARQIESLKDEVKAQQRALDEELRSAQAAIAESLSKAKEASAAAEFAAGESDRLAALQKNGLVSEQEALRARRTADERLREAQTAEFAASRVTRDLDARTQDRLARIARLKNEIAGIEGTRGEAAAAAKRLGYEIDQRLVRAPIDGTLAEISPLKAGSMVRPGDRICSILPEGSLKVVALFPPTEALGRVHEGQNARIRLDAFPWTQYGSPLARVSHVAQEVRDGQIRVELSLNPAQHLNIPLQHGLPAEVDIEVERLSPMAMVLRSAGASFRVSAASVGNADAR